MIALEPFDTPARTLERLLERVLPDLAPGTSVLIKPDWNARSAPRPGENTTRAFLDGVLRWLQDRGVERVALAHSSLLTPPDVPYTSFDALLEIAGCTELLEDYPGVRLIDLEVEPMELRGGFVVPAVLREFDVLIDCVRLKTHMGTQIAVGCKGLMGLLPDSEHLRMHRDGLDALLAKLAVAVPPDVVLVEADVGMQGEGPHHGDAVPCGFYLGGTDAFEVDTAAAQLMGMEPGNVEHLAALARLLDRPFEPLPGPARRFVRHFTQPTGVIRPVRGARVFPGDSCATCHVAAEGILDYARDNPTQVRALAGLARALLVDGVDLYMGHQPVSRTPKGRCVALGECARSFAEAHDVPLVGGCPVRRDQAQAALIDAIGRRSS